MTTHTPTCIDHTTCDGMIAARDEAIHGQARIIASQADDIRRLNELVASLSRRLAAASECLGRAAERRGVTAAEIMQVMQEVRV